MRERKRSLTFFLMALFIIGSLPITNSVSAGDEVDNWPSGDAWLYIELLSWSANETVEWDNNNGLPDLHFEICIEADGINIDCINTQTWDNQMELVNPWNYSIDIPDYSNILNITIECRDNDALNDDECDMNSELDEWKLYAEYNWSATPTKGVIGNGDGDENGTWKKAASEWRFTIAGYGDEDSDGVPDNIDTCEGTDADAELLNQSQYPGCSWNQKDIDGDGVASLADKDSFDARVINISGGSRVLNSMPSDYSSCRTSSNAQFSEMFSIIENGNLTSWVNQTKHYENPYSCPYDSSTDELVFSEQIIAFDFTTLEATKISEFHLFDADNCLSNNAYNGAIQQIVKHTGNGEYIMHCYTSMDPNQDPGKCPIQSSIYLFDQTNVTHIMDLEFAFLGDFDCSQTNPSAHSQYRNSFQSHLGAFGDFNSDGLIDFVRGNNTRCELYYGLMNPNFSFFGPQTISQTGCETNLIAFDLDFDGYDDISSFSQTIFSDDGSFEFIPHSGGIGFSRGYADVYHLNHYDIDSDGDQDLVRLGCTFTVNMNRNWCAAKLIENMWILDEDADGVKDSDDICPSTELGSIVDLQGCSTSQRDTDNDNVTDDIDLCPSTMSAWTVDDDGCATEQLDDDNDGINNALDECPETPEGDLVNLRGCSFEDSQDLDSDGDGVLDSDDACPNTPADVTVDSIGCDLDGNQTADTDSDGDGVYDSLDECANTPAEATADFKGCPMDSDFDGVYDGIDECPSSNNPSPSDMDKSSEIDSTGCFIDAAGSENDSGSAAFGCLGMLVMVGMVVFVVRKVRSPKQEQVFYAQTQSVRSPVQQQFVSTPQISSRERELEHLSRQAQIEARKLRQQLANQTQLTQKLQTEAAQKQISDAALAQKQHELAVAQREKEELEAKLAEAEKNTHIVQNITYNIQDSAISGDITNKIN